MRDTLLQEIRERLVDGRLPCAQAMAIASALGMEPADVGQAANQTGIRISHCQLGLFGYGPKTDGLHKIVRAATQVSEAAAKELGEAATGMGITCVALWQAAARLSLSRLEAAGASEALGLRVSICQLGCFPRPVEGR